MNSSTSTAADLPAASTTVRLVRAADQLDVVVELFDVTIADGTVTPGPGGLARLTFGSQHTTERTFADDVVPGSGGIEHIAAGPSVVAAPLADPFPFTVAGIFAAAGAQLHGQATDGPADGTVTALELPTGLVLSPAEPARLTAESAPRTIDGVAEVWLARLERTTGGAAPDMAVIDNLSELDLLATAVPDAETRARLVTNTTDTAGPPLTAGRLWLSSSGAFADLHGEWDASLALYDHRIATGRDLHVQAVTLGYLVPFGHRAAITEISQRAIVDDVDGDAVGVMQVERYLTIVESQVGTRPHAQFDGRGLPLTTLVASTTETLPIRLETVADVAGQPIDGASDVVARDGGVDLTVEYRCTDRAGNTVSFALPATFLDDDVAYGTGPNDAPARLRAVATEPTRLHRREVDLGGQPVAYADPTTPAGAVSKATHQFLMRWDPPDPEAVAADLEAALSPAIFAAMEHAEVIDAVVGAVTGDIAGRVGVTFHPRWLELGNAAANFDLAFLTLDQPSSSVIGADSLVGAVAQLDVVAEVFNQVAGVGPQLDTVDGEWSIESIIGEAAKTIGNIALRQLVAVVENALPGVDIPGTTVTLDGPTVTSEFSFCPTLHDLPAVGFDATDDTRCCLHLTATASLDDGVEAEFVTEMRIENFLLFFPPGESSTSLVTVDFASIVATLHSDGSSSLVPTIREWDFGGTISMLLKLLDGLGLGTSDLKIVGQLIEIDTSFNLPDLTLGVAELKNFNIGIGVDLPIGDGVGAVSIGVGSPSDPLDIEVLMFGATFWLEIELAFSGPPVPSQSIGMGVSVYWEMLDFDAVVARATFTLRLSASWKLEGNEVVFRGAVSLEGEIELFGLVSGSASIVCSLTYRSEDETMVLRGTIHYAVDSFLGEITSGQVPIGETTIEMGDGQSADSLAGVPARVTRTPGVGAANTGSPSFADRYAPAEWADYCDAFA